MPRTKEQFEKIREETKEKILLSALELFAKKGYSNTSISDIASLAGISKGLAYNYFEGKHKLMEEVITILFTEVEKMFFVLEEIKDPFEKIQKVIDLMFDWAKDSEDFWRLYSSILLQADVKEIVDKVAGNYLDGTLKEIEKIFKKMKIKNPAAESMLFGAMLDGIGFHILIVGDEYPVDKMRKFLKKKYSKESLLL
jgi:AcrR family transcriptional regulator